ncbi:Exon junction complex Pym protein [Rutstroemia sp. NJR-2017a BBW]|nr:Exon junction complex Pym protein [Rutstroemia sp. NJR-2017a BBW]
MPSVPTPSKSGIIETQTGERHIPSSVRADGTKRKEIKIRPGYKPPEDVEVYKNRSADAWKNRGSGGVPGSAASSKNAKRREARKKAKAAEEGDEEAKGSESSDWRQGKETTGEKQEEPTPEVDPEAERQKEAKKFLKKLKQAQALKEKSQQDGAKLLPEQFAKVIKINELIRELDQLGFDANGEPKDKAEVADVKKDNEETASTDV